MPIITSYTLTPGTDHRPPALSICGIHANSDGEVTASWKSPSSRVLGDDGSFSDVCQFFKDSQKSAEKISTEARGQMYSLLKTTAVSSLIAAAAGGYFVYNTADIDAQRMAALASADFQNAVKADAHEQAVAQYSPVMARTVIDQFNAGAQTVILNKDDFDRAVQSVAAELHPALEERMLDDKHPTDFLGKGTSVLIVGLAAFFAVAGLGGAGQAAYRAIRFNRFANVNERGLRDFEAAQAASNPSSKRDDAAGAPAPAA
jgi:hypothetical protein